MVASPVADPYDDPQAAAALLDPGQADVRGGIGAVRHDRRARLLGDADERTGARVVGVDDRRARPVRRGLGLPGRGSVAPVEPLEQRQLRVAVGLPRSVELEVLVAQVRQDRCVVGDRPDAIRRQAVGRRLEDRGPVARLGHRPERVLQVRGARRREVFRVGLAEPADLRLDGPDEPGRQPRRLERRDGEERCRRLAVGAGDPDDAEGPARVAVPPRRGVGQGRPRRGHDELRQRALGHGTLDQGGSRAARRSVVEQVVAVDALAPDRHEERPGPEAARVVGHAVHVEGRERRRPDRPAALAGPHGAERGRQPLDQLAERPRVAWLRGGEQVRDGRRARHASPSVPPAGSPAGRRSRTRDSRAITRPAR